MLFRSGTLALVHTDTPSLRVSHETIYTAIYAMPRGELRSEVIGWLRFGHAKRGARTRGEDRRGKIHDMVSIHDRPPEIEERLIPGHWEGDLIKGAYNRSAVGTLVERTTLFTVLARMDNASAESAVKGFSHVLSRIEAQKRLSMTYDQGKEMAAHAHLTAATGVKVYFADPHSPWQRGINENTNGLLESLIVLSSAVLRELIPILPGGTRVPWLNAPARSGLGCRLGTVRGARRVWFGALRWNRASRPQQLQ